MAVAFDPPATTPPAPPAAPAPAATPPNAAATPAPTGAQPPAPAAPAPAPAPTAAQVQAAVEKLAREALAREQAARGAATPPPAPAPAGKSDAELIAEGVLGDIGAFRKAAGVDGLETKVMELIEKRIGDVSGQLTALQHQRAQDELRLEINRAVAIKQELDAAHHPEVEQAFTARLAHHLDGPLQKYGWAGVQQLLRELNLSADDLAILAAVDTGRKNKLRLFGNVPAAAQNPPHLAGAGAVRPDPQADFKAAELERMQKTAQRGFVVT